MYSVWRYIYRLAFYVPFGRETTADINVQCVFNNAGFIVTGFFESAAEGKQLANIECNATAAAKVRQSAR